MKRKLHLFLISSFVFISYSQGAILTHESFDGVISWNTKVIEGSYNWEYVTAGGYPACEPHSKGGMGRFESYVTPSGISSLLISPSFDLSDCRGAIKFWMYRAWGGEGSPMVEAYISTDDTTGENATLLGTAHYHFPNEPAADAIGWYEYTFHIPENYNSTKNFLILKAIGVGAGGMIYIDDISVIGVPHKDASIQAITSPINGAEKGQYDVSVTLENNGSDTLTSCDIMYDINGTTGSYSWTGKIPHLASENVTICNDFNFPGGYSSITVYSGLSGDEDLTNDTLKAVLSFPPLPLPYFQKFDSEIEFSSFQTKIYNGSYGWEYSESGKTHSSPGAATFDSYNSHEGEGALFISPTLDLSTQTGVLTFWMYRNSSYEYRDKLEIYVSSDDTTSTNSALLGSIYRDITLGPVVSEDGWYQYSYDIPDSFNTSENYIIFKSISDYGDEIYIDDISVTQTQKVVFSGAENGRVSARINTSQVESGSFVDDGSDIVFTATPFEHYVIKQWEVNGVVLDDYTDRIYMANNINEPINIHLDFDAITFPVSYSTSNGEGTLTASVLNTSIASGELIIEGSDVTFYATPPEHYRIKNWVVNNTLVTDYFDSSFTFSELDDTLQVSVEFEPIKYPVIFSSVENGGTLASSVSDTSINPGALVIKGSTVLFTAAPSAQHQVKQWVVNDTVVASNSSNTLSLALFDTLNVTVDFEMLSSTIVGKVDKLYIYPNPANDGFYIKTGSSANTLLKIYSFEGRLVASKFVNNGDYVDISDLTQGIYILKMDNTNRRLVVTGK